MDKAALVTGGSSGIGFAIATMLRENGFALTLAARTSAKVDAAAETLGAYAVVADVAKDEDCRRLVDEHRERHGRLDVLVNSAGVGIAGPVDELETKHIDLQLNVNLRGTILVTAAALPLLREARGLIVNIASIAGTGPAGRLSVYVDTPMTSWAPVPPERMIRAEDCAEVVRALLNLSPYARLPHVVIERVDSGDFGA